MEYVHVVDVQYVGEYLDDDYCACIEIYGRRADGRSVCVRVRAFEAYFYCRAPDGHDPQVVADALREAFKVRLLDLSAEKRSKGGWLARSADDMAAITIRTEVVRRTPIRFFQPECDMIRVIASHPDAIAPLRDTIVADPCVSLLLPDGTEVELPPNAYEANVEFVLRFMVDTSVCCGAWLGISGAIEEAELNGCSSPDLVCLDAAQIVPLTDEEVQEIGLVSKIRALSYDIECNAELGRFPEADVNNDAIINIACDVVDIDNRPLAEIEASAKMVVFCLGGASQKVAGDDVELHCYYNEADMLVEFARYVRIECDPDVITGWNTPNFDWKYIIDRAKHLNIERRGATQFSRQPLYKTRNRVSEKSTKAAGTTKDNEVHIPGRVVFDLLGPIRKNNKLRSYKLDAVAEHFLNERKEDVNYKEISKLWMGTDEERGRLVSYCAQDARLPRRLMFHQLLWTQYVEMARVCRVPTTYLVTKGEQIKVFTQLLYAARQRGFVLDFIPHKPSGNGGKAGRNIGYKGATVLEPERGFYDTPVATLDFTALYPSIARAHNLCHATHVRKEDAEKMSEDDYEVSPTGEIFVRPHVRAGILPAVLEDLHVARQAAKKLMGEAKARGDTLSHSVYDKRQLALKVSANSVYGFTGVTVGRLPDNGIASSITAYGRQMIDLTKETVEAVGPPGTRVIYGDTDSVMILYPCAVEKGPDGKLVDVERAIAEARAFALKGAEAVNMLFPYPIFLEYEKVFWPYLLISKKRYAGGYFEDPAPVRMFMKAMGVESQRRDNARMVPRVLEEVLTCLMDDLSPERAIATAADTVRAVVNGPVTDEEIIAKIAAGVQDTSDADNNSIGERMLEALTENYHTGVKTGKTPHSMKKDWCKIAVDVTGISAAAEVVDVTLRRNVTLDDHIMSKAYSRAIEKYEGVFPQIEVVKNMAKRNGEIAPGDVVYYGDRIDKFMQNRSSDASASASAGASPTDDIASGYRRYLGDRIDYIIIAPTAQRPDKLTIFQEKKKTNKVGGHKGLIPIGTRTRTIKHDGVRIQETYMAMGIKKTVQRSADRSEDPEWAVANGDVPDALYYIEKQLINPTARLLAPLLGGKTEAVQKMLGPLIHTSRPSRGFTMDRFSSEFKDMLGIRAKRKVAPTRQKKLDDTAWDKLHKDNPAPPKRPRVVGPMDAFMRGAAHGKEEDDPVV